MKKFLDDVNSSNDVKKLNIPELKILAEELREFLVNTVSKHGGHLSSNLGAVELTLALHKVTRAMPTKLLRAANLNLRTFVKKTESAVFQKPKKAKPMLSTQVTHQLPFRQLLAMPKPLNLREAPQELLRLSETAL